MLVVLRWKKKYLLKHLKSGIKKNVGSQSFRVAVALASSAAVLFYAAFWAAGYHGLHSGSDFRPYSVKSGLGKLYSAYLAYLAAIAVS